MKRGGFVKGTILGAIMGAVAGVLLAPKSGRQTQADLKRKVKGTYREVHEQLRQMSDEVSGRMDTLKLAAKDLKGEARAQSHELIRRAEVLKQDLRVSASNLAESGERTKEVTLKNVKHLLAEGAEVMTELERVTKQLAASAKGKLGDAARGEGGEK